MHLQERTREQLLEDFNGLGPEKLKLLNLIHSVYLAISTAGSAVTWDSITELPEVVAALAAAETPALVTAADPAATGDWTVDGAAVVALLLELKAVVNDIAAAMGAEE